MKKYDKSAVMKKAWEIRKVNKKSFSESLKISWKIAKASVSENVTFEFVSNEKFTIDMKTGVVSGKTYNSRNRIKKDFCGKWNGKNWTVDTNKVLYEMNKFSVLYATVYMASKDANKNCESDTETGKVVKTAVKNWLENDERAEGYIWVTRWNDGTITRKFVG